MRLRNLALMAALLAAVALVTGATFASLSAGLAQSSSDASAMLSTGFGLWWHVIAGGGGHASSADYALDGSIGQPAVGELSGASYRLGAGFWPGIGAEAPTPPTSTPTATPTGTVTPTPTATATGSPTPTSTPTATPTGPPPLVVNTTDDTDDGTCDATHCSLREATNAAGFHAGPDTITFNIPSSDPGCDGAGVCTIRPTSYGLYLTDDGTTIDGYTQPGASPNTNPFGQPINAVLKIVLDGSLLPECCYSGVDIRSSNNMVRGLVIQRFYTGIDVVDADGNRFEGNFIGTDVHGSADLGNRCSGISISGVQGGAGSSNNVVGGSSPQARNLISGNGCVGVAIGPTGNNRVQGNYIGTDATGTAPLPNNTDGVYIFNVSNDNLIGGAAEGEANLIAFNGGDGVEVSGDYGAKHNTITRNRIHSNTSKGISLPSGGNEGLATPVITTASATQVSGTACAHCTVEVFSDTADEGAIYEGTTTADASGHWTFTKPGGLTGPNVTATATDANGNTSEFSAPVSLPQVTPTPGPPIYLPLILKGAGQ